MRWPPTGTCSGGRGWTGSGAPTSRRCPTAGRGGSASGWCRRSAGTPTAGRRTTTSRWSASAGSTPARARRPAAPTGRLRRPGSADADAAVRTTEERSHGRTGDPSRDGNPGGAADGAAAAVARRAATRRTPHLRVRHRDAQGPVRAPGREGVSVGPDGGHDRAGDRVHHQPGAGGAEAGPDPRLRPGPAHPAVQGLHDRRDRAGGITVTSDEENTRPRIAAGPLLCLLSSLVTRHFLASARRIDLMITGSLGTAFSPISLAVFSTLAIFSTTSIPSITLPKTA